MPKILTSVLSYNNGHYIDWQKAQEDTFGSVECKDMDIIYYYGDHDKVELKDNKLYVDVPEGLFNIGNKTMKMFEYVLKNFEFDYLLRLNSSAFIIPDNVVRFIDEFTSKERCYMGIHRHCRYGNLKSRSGVLPGLEKGQGRKLWLRRSNVHFASGMGYILSRDVIEKHVDDYYANAYTRQIYNEIIDDVALGIIIHHTQIADYIKIEIQAPDHPFVYRCKTKDPKECVKIMHELYSTFIHTDPLIK